MGFCHRRVVYQWQQCQTARLKEYGQRCQTVTHTMPGRKGSYKKAIWISLLWCYPYLTPCDSKVATLVVQEIHECPDTPILDHILAFRATSGTTYRYLVWSCFSLEPTIVQLHRYWLSYIRNLMSRKMYFLKLDTSTDSIVRKEVAHWLC